MLLNMLGGVISWWRDGEEGAVKVYRKAHLAALSVFFALVALYLCSPTFRQPFLLPIYATFIGRALVESRRAIIFKQTTSAIRAALGSLREVPLRDIVGVKKSTIATSFALRGFLISGLELQLRDGTLIRTPLDFRGKEEIEDRLNKTCL